MGKRFHGLRFQQNAEPHDLFGKMFKLTSLMVKGQKHDHSEKNCDSDEHKVEGGQEKLPPLTSNRGFLYSNQQLW